MIKIAPSILSADFAEMGKAVEALKEWNADYIHLDVMDGAFVPNITFGAPMCKALRPHSDLIFDVHLMVEMPEKWVTDFKNAGADIITIHVESDRHAHRTLSLIRSMGMKAGIALNPSTSPEAVRYLLPACDLVLVMSVNPGFGGQRFIPETPDKIARIKQMLLESGCRADIEVDGGINEQTAKVCVDAGANVLVAGNSVFHADNPKKTIETLRG